MISLSYVFPLIAVALLFMSAIIWTVVSLAMWVYADAKDRGMDNAALWVCLVIFVPPFIGILIYLVVRSTNGRAFPCPQCGFTVKEAMGHCPRCGAAQPNLNERPAIENTVSKKRLKLLFAALITVACLFVIFFICMIGFGSAAAMGGMRHFW